MSGPNLPVNVDATYADSGTDPSIKLHQGHHDTLHSYVNKLDTTFLSPSDGQVPVYDSGTGTYKPGGVSGGSNATTDRILYVSKAGSDSNDGLSWSSAFLTLGAALTELGTFSGAIYMGGGTFVESAGLTFSATNPQQAIFGMAGRYGTTIRLDSNGTLFSMVNKNGGELHNLTLAFNTGITGTLLKLDNSFQFYCHNVRFDGDPVSGQTGVWMNNNSGDCHFIRCKYVSLDIGILSETSISWFVGGVVSACTTGVKSGDSTGAVGIGGMQMSHTTFVGSGDYYIDIDGLGLAYTFDNCWFDGSATTAVKVGNTARTQGPRMFALTNCPSLFGATTSLLLNKATRVYLDNVKFHHGGATPPTELSIPDPTTVAEGHINGVRSNQSLFIESMVPETWEGYRGYINFSAKITGVETTTYNDDLGGTFKKIVIRVNGRVSGDAQSVITYPTAFASSQFTMTANSTGFGTMTVGQSSLTIPTGLTGSGIIVIEGW